MTIGRTYPAGWALGDKYTSAQANGIDIALTWAADKRAAQTDSIAAVWSAVGAGRLVPTIVAGTDGNTTYQPGGGNQVIIATGLTANRIYTLGNTAAVNGDEIEVINETGFLLQIVDGPSATQIANLCNTGQPVINVASGGISRSARFRYWSGNWRQVSHGKGNPWVALTVTAAGNYIVPFGVTGAFVLGCGGGGGGGAGVQDAAPAVDRFPGSGAGGGGSRWGVTWVPLTPGATVACTPGTAGAGGAAAGAAGGDGGDSTFGALATFRGAKGGAGNNSAITTNTNDAIMLFGGWPMRGTTVNSLTAWNASSATFDGDLALILSQFVDGQGGRGAAGFGLGSGDGRINAIGSGVGGTGAASGTHASTWRGGKGGGGGGAGPLGSGGNGGAGGNGNGAGAGTAGAAGTAAAANTGAGGGGGGAGGNGSAGAGAFGAGGNGGTGLLLIVPTYH